MLNVECAGGRKECYFTPLAAELEQKEGPSLVHAAARLRRGAVTGLLYEAEACEGFAHATLAALRRGETIMTGHGGKILFMPSPGLATETLTEDVSVRRIGRGRRNFSLVVANEIMLKVHRRLDIGEDPEVEVLRFLTEVAHFAHTPPLLGVVEHIDRSGNRTVLAILQTYVRNQGDARAWMLGAMKRSLEAAALTSGKDGRAPREEFAAYEPHMRSLGMCTAWMHMALATPCANPAFQAEELTLDDVRSVAEAAKTAAERAFVKLQTIANTVSADQRPEAERLLLRRQECLSLIGKLVQQPHGAIKIRIHGNYRLGRLLIVKNDVMIVDFRGGGSAPYLRRAKLSPLRDLASMLRSFVHTIAVARQDLARLLPDPQNASARLREELIQFSQIFIRVYWEAARESPIWVEDEGTRRRLLVLHLLTDLLDDFEYESERSPELIEMLIES